ncbi:MAG: site-specific integrase [Mesorhizobium sp.]|nr:MAG: site-specific integrase [Mesorhizobium sp.]
MSEIRAKLFRGSWYAVWSDTECGTQRRSLRTKDSAEAQRRLIDFRRDMSTPVGSLVGDLVEAYLDDKKGRVAAHERLVFAWKQAKATYGHLRPDQITRQVCEAYADLRRLAGRKDATILKEVNVVRQAMNWGKVTGALFEAPSAPPPRDCHLTKTEYQRLLTGCSQPHIRLYCVLALTTAGRKGAILELTWDRVDFDRNMIRLAVNGQRNRKGRAVTPMTDQTRAELLVAREAAQTPYVIEYAGNRVQDIKKGFAGAVRRAGLTGTVPHDLRHSAAVWMAEAGVDFNEIAQYLGHTDPSITYKVYARFSPNHLRKAASALDF